MNKASKIGVMKDEAYITTAIIIKKAAIVIAGLEDERFTVLSIFVVFLSF